MENIFNKFMQLMKVLDENKVEYVLIGGLAINLHGFSRNTQDIGLFINPTEDNTNNFKNSLMKIFNDNEINEINFMDFEDYPVIRYGTDYGFCIDIITRIGERFSFHDLIFQIKQVDGINIKLADIKTLYKLKENKFREIDQLDLKFLKSKINENDDKKI